MTASRQRGVARRLKRAFDLGAAVAGAVVAAPIVAACVIAIRQSMGGPVLFRQKRSGFGGRPFHIYKFRTMNDARGPDGALLPDAERLTRVGRFLRAASLDELPQLINILRGEVSLVGPRPLIADYFARYSPEQARRLDVIPGITGWAQIHGRNAISWEEKFALDVWYVDHWSLLLDAKILAMTARAVIAREGISSGDHATMANFMGTPANGASAHGAKEG